MALSYKHWRTPSSSPRPGHARHVQSLVPQARVEWAERAQGVPVRGDQEIHITPERHLERKTTAELAGGDAEHGLQMAPQALRRRVIETVRDVAHRQPRIAEQVRRVYEPHPGEVGFR